MGVIPLPADSPFRKGSLKWNCANVRGERCYMNFPTPAGAEKTSRGRNRMWVTTILDFHLRLVKTIGCRIRLTWV